MREALDVAILGGGIGGLTAALALQRVGVRVRVLEQASRPRRGGGALMLWPNALGALESLGVGAAVAAAGFPQTRTDFRAWDGRGLGTLPLAEICTPVAAAPIVIRREALLDILLAACADGTVSFGHECVGFVRGPDAVTLALADGTHVEARALVAADGVASQVRTELLGESAPRDLGFCAWGGTLELGRSLFTAGVGFSTIGRGRRICVAPSSASSIYWYASAIAKDGAATESSEAKERVLSEFRDCHAPVPSLIEATPADAIFETRIRDRSPSSRWGIGRVTLLGDAAHPMTPDLAQGACQAIEDAVVLADMWQHHGDVDAALRAYETARQGPTARATHLSWITATLSMRPDRLFCLARDAATDAILRVARRELSNVVSPAR